MRISHLGALAALALTQFATSNALAQAPSDGTLALDDCRVLTGSRQVAAFKKWRADVELRAQRGERWGLRTLAGVANNVMACHEETLAPEQGWVVVSESAQAPTETRAPTGIADIGKRPAVLADLRAAVERTHAAGAFDPAYRRISAEWVVKYAAVLPDLLAQAFEDVAGAYQVDCVLKRTIGNRSTKFSCQSDRRVQAQLLPHVPEAVRAAAQARATQWAQALDPTKVDDN